MASTKQRVGCRYAWARFCISFVWAHCLRHSSCLHPVAGSRRSPGVGATEDRRATCDRPQAIKLYSVTREQDSQAAGLLKGACIMSHYVARFPRRPRKTNTWPENGLCSSLVCTRALSPSKPRRRSVTPAAIQMCVFGGRVIIVAATPAPHARAKHQRRFQPANGFWETRCRWHSPRVRAQPEKSGPAQSPVRAGSCGAFANSHRQQTNAVGSHLAQPAVLIELASIMHLVGVDPMLLCHLSHGSSGLHRQFRNPALVGNASPLPLAPSHLRNH